MRECVGLFIRPGRLSGVSNFRYALRWSVFCFIVVTPLYAVEEPEVVSPSEVPAASPLTKYSLPELLEKITDSPLLTSEADAIMRLAKAKQRSVEMRRWLSTFEAKAYGGVVPNVEWPNQSNLNGYTSYDFENDFSFNHMGGFFRTEIDMIQPLYTFGKISHYQDAAKQGFTLAEWEQRKRRGEFRMLIKKAYYTLLLSQESMATLKDVEGKLNDANEKVEKLLMKDAENVSEVDRLKIKVFMADVRNRMLDAERGMKLSRSALSDLLGLSGDWVVDEDRLAAEKVQDIQKTNVISAALRARPDLQQVATLINIKESERLAVRANLFPTIFAAGKINYAVAPGREDIKNPFLVDEFNKLDFGAVLGLKIDLGAHRTLNQMEEMQAEIDRLKGQRAQLMTKVRLDTERVYEEASAAANAIQINEDGLRAARSWLTSAGLAFNLGTAETKEVLESFAAYFKARADLVRSIYGLNMSLSELSDVVGTELVPRLQ